MTYSNELLQWWLIGFAVIWHIYKAIQYDYDKINERVKSLEEKK